MATVGMKGLIIYRKSRDKHVNQSVDVFGRRRRLGVVCRPVSASRVVVGSSSIRQPFLNLAHTELTLGRQSSDLDVTGVRSAAVFVVPRLQQGHRGLGVRLPRSSPPRYRRARDGVGRCRRTLGLRPLDVPLDDTRRWREIRPARRGVVDRCSIDAIAVNVVVVVTSCPAQHQRHDLVVDCLLIVHVALFSTTKVDKPGPFNLSGSVDNSKICQLKPLLVCFYRALAQLIAVSVF